MNEKNLPRAVFLSAVVLELTGKSKFLGNNLNPFKKEATDHAGNDTTKKGKG